MASHNDSRTGLMGTYDANDTTIMVDGHEMFGFNGDTMFTASYDQDRGEADQDPQGTGHFSKNNKTGGTITINLDETSPCNSILENLANTGNFPVDIVTSTYHLSAIHCYVKKNPELQGGAKSSNRAWTISALNMDETTLLTA